MRSDCCSVFHHQSLPAKALLLIACAFVSAFTGCGTTRSSNTIRTGTEQLLISDAIDRTVQSINFSKLAGETVFFDKAPLYEAVDDGYLIGSLRQHLLASGCILKDDRAQATYIIEPRAGAIGTDNEDLLFGIPATNLPQVTLLAGLPPALPEIPFIKRSRQRGVAKIAVFAYNRETGEPVWQSGIASNESSSNNIWFLGAGPFKRGTIHDGTSYGDRKIHLPGIDSTKPKSEQVVSIGQEAVFAKELMKPKTPDHPTAYLAAAPNRSGGTLPPPVDASASSAGPAIFPPPAPAETE